MNECLSEGKAYIPIVYDYQLEGYNMILTSNETKILRLLGTSIGKEYSINEIAKACSISPNGAYKILAKLKKENILKSKEIANLISYKINFEDAKTASVLNLALMPESLEGKVKLRAEDLKKLEAVTKACILFGSYITTKREPNDLDILFVVELDKFKEYKQALKKAQEIMPVKIQDVVQAANDLKENLTKNDPIITEALRNGIVLWGFETIMQAIKDASQSKEMP